MRARMFGALTDFEQPFDGVLGNEAQYAEGQNEKQDEGAEPARVGLLRQVPDNEQHVSYQGGQPPGHADLGNLLFGYVKHRLPGAAGLSGC